MTQKENNLESAAENNLPAENLSGETQTQEVSHEVTIYAEPIAHLGSFTITNSLLNTWLVVIFFIVISFVIRKKISAIPRGIQNVAEIIVEGAFELIDGVTSDRRKTLQFFPLVFILFLFILVNNWTGLLPGVGSIGFIENGEHGAVFIPMFRGGTADFNTTFALALISIVLTHVFGVIAVGGWAYLNKFINIKAFLEIPKKVMRNPAILLINPVKAFVGVIEIVGEIAKIASLSFRLFGNVFAGEVLLVSIAGILALGAPIPFMFLELIVGVVQALVFSMLILVFLTISTASEEH